MGVTFGGQILFLVSTSSLDLRPSSGDAYAGAMAAFNDRTNSATCLTMAGSCWWDAMRFTMALPTITPSAIFDTRAASSGVATPKPTATGDAETFLSF